VVIKYKTTAIAIPSDLKLAMIQWVCQIYDASPDGGKVIGQYSNGPASFTFLTKDSIPQFVLDMISRYRLMPGV